MPREEISNRMMNQEALQTPPESRSCFNCVAEGHLRGSVGTPNGWCVGIVEEKGSGLLIDVDVPSRETTNVLDQPGSSWGREYPKTGNRRTPARRRREDCSASICRRHLCVSHCRQRGYEKFHQRNTPQTAESISDSERGVHRHTLGRLDQRQYHRNGGHQHRPRRTSSRIS